MKPGKRAAGASPGASGRVCQPIASAPLASALAKRTLGIRASIAPPGFTVQRTSA